ncbi:MAG: type II toxin-antitoxin system PemK/MazF family toxin [Cyanophyceae cyanobacterium]
MKRGDVYIANLNPSRGSEQAGIRPAIVVQRNQLAHFTRTIVIVPLTSNLRRTRIPGTVLIPAGEEGLTEDSVALCYQVAVIDQQRLIWQIGTLSPQYLTSQASAIVYLEA